MRYNILSKSKKIISHASIITVISLISLSAYSSNWLGNKNCNYNWQQASASQTCTADVTGTYNKQTSSSWCSIKNAKCQTGHGGTIGHQSWGGPSAQVLNLWNCSGELQLGECS